MRKSQKILLGIFFTGVLLCGVGTGVAIGEFTSMTYLGERNLGEGMQVTSNFDFPFDPAEGDITVRLPRFGFHWEKLAELEEDPEVPENMIRFEATYVPQGVDLFVRFDQELLNDIDDLPAEERQMQGTVWLDWWYYDELQILLQEKDTIIEDLKNHSFASYRAQPLRKVVVKVNPATAEFVQTEE